MERRLGRGLGVLMGQTAPFEYKMGVLSIPIGALRPNPHQPRKSFDGESLAELADSVRQHGILQPVVVRSSGDAFEIISGERRWRAAKIANLTEIPAVVRERVSDAEMLELALVENVQREDLNSIERAEGFHAMMQTLSLTQEQVALKVGLRRATVANHLRLLDLPAPVQDGVRRGLLSMGHARALLGTADATTALELMQRVVRQGLSVRQVEELVRQRLGATPQVHVAAPTKVPGTAWVQELEARMRVHLGTKVELRNGAQFRGHITIQYFGREDLERIASLLAPKISL